MNKELYNKIKKLTDKDIETLNAFLSSKLTGKSADVIYVTATKDEQGSEYYSRR